MDRLNDLLQVSKIETYEQTAEKEKEMFNCVGIFGISMELCSEHSGAELGEGERVDGLFAQ